MKIWLEIVLYKATIQMPTTYVIAPNISIKFPRFVVYFDKKKKINRIIDLPVFLINGISSITKCCVSIDFLTLR